MRIKRNKKIVALFLMLCLVCQLFNGVAYADVDNSETTAYSFEDFNISNGTYDVTTGDYKGSDITELLNGGIFRGNVKATVRDSYCWLVLFNDQGLSWDGLQLRFNSNGSVEVVIGELIKSKQMAGDGVFVLSPEYANGVTSFNGEAFELELHFNTTGTNNEDLQMSIYINEEHYIGANDDVDYVDGVATIPGAVTKIPEKAESIFTIGLGGSTFELSSDANIGGDGGDEDEGEVEGEENYTKVSFSDYGILDGTYDGSWLDGVLKNVTSMNNVQFEGIVTFPEPKAGVDAIWNGIYIGAAKNAKGSEQGISLCYADGGIYLFDLTPRGNGATLTHVPDSLTGKTMCGAPIKIGLAFKYVNETDATVILSIDGKTYYEETIPGLVEHLGPRAMVNSSTVGSAVTITSVKDPSQGDGEDEGEENYTTVSFCDYGIQDGTYDGSWLDGVLKNTTSMNNVQFEGIVTFPQPKAGVDAIWNGIYIGAAKNAKGSEQGLSLCYADGGIYLFDLTPRGNGATLTHVPDSLTGKTMCGEPVKIGLAFKYANETDATVILSIDGKTYYEETIPGLVAYLGPRAMVNSSAVGSTVTIASTKEPTQGGGGEEEDDDREANYTKVSFCDYGILDGTYDGIWLDGILENITSMHNVKFEGIVTFPEPKAGVDAIWNGIYIGAAKNAKGSEQGISLCYADGGIYLFDLTPRGNGATLTHVPDSLTGKTMCGVPVEIGLAFEYVNETDATVILSIDGKKYYEETIPGLAEHLGPRAMVLSSAAGSRVIIDSTKEATEDDDKREEKYTKVTFSDYGITDGVYDGTWMDGSLPKVKNMNNIKFEGQVIFPAQKAGVDSFWNAIMIGAAKEATGSDQGFLMCYADGGIYLYDLTQIQTKGAIPLVHVPDSIAGKVQSGIPVEVGLAFEYVNKNDVTVVFSIDGRIYYDKTIKNLASRIGPRAMVNSTGLEVIIASTGKDIYDLIETGPAPTINKDFKKINLDSYGIISDTYKKVGLALSAEGECKLKSLNKVVFSDTVQFSEAAGAQLRIGGGETPWHGLVFMSAGGGKIEMSDAEGIFPSVMFYSEFAGVNLLGQDIELTLSFEYVDHDEDGEKDDLKLGVFFNGKPYKDRWIYLDNQAPKMGSYCGIYMQNEECYLTVKTTTKPVDFERYGFTKKWERELGLK